MAIVMTGVWAWSSFILNVASSSTRTSLSLCGITAIFGISASNSCILQSVMMICSFFGVCEKSWLDAMVLIPNSCASEISINAMSSPWEISTSTRSAFSSRIASDTTLRYWSAERSASPPSLLVRIVNSNGTSPRISLSSSNACLRTSSFSISAK